MSPFQPLRLLRLCLCCAALASPVALAELDFRELVIRLAHPVDGTPRRIRLAEGAGLMAVGRDEGGWRYSVISLAGGDVVAGGRIPEDVIFYDVGDVLGRGSEQLCFFTERGVSALDPADGALVKVVEIDSIYHGRTMEGPAYSDFVRDVDGDERDDVLAPLYEGWLLARRGDDGFDRYTLEVRPRVRVFEGGVSYRPREPLIGDADGDGRNDLVFLVSREFLSFVQEEGAAYPRIARRDPVDAPLASEEELVRWQRDDGQVDQSDLQIEEIELVKDFNGDGVLDLLTEKQISEGVLDRRSEYHLYVGRREGETLRYAREPDGSILSDGVQFEPLTVDVDGDGLTDLATPSTRLGLTRIVAALFSGRMGVDLDVYRMRPDGSYSEDSDYRTRFKVEFDLTTGLFRYPAVVIADLDGDGATELLVQEEEDALTLYPGVGEPSLFAESDQVLELPLPRNGQMVRARDLNDDGRADLLVRYGPADGAERVGELRVLISRPPG